MHTTKKKEKKKNLHALITSIIIEGELKLKYLMYIDVPVHGE